METRIHECWKCKTTWEALVEYTPHTHKLSGEKMVLCLSQRELRQLPHKLSREKMVYCPQCGDASSCASPFTSNMGTATELIQDVDWLYDARLYKLSVPMQGYTQWDDNGEEYCDEHEYVIVSAIPQHGHLTEPETYIFPATAEGVAIEMLELPHSRRGVEDHAWVLAEAGYKIIQEVPT